MKIKELAEEINELEMETRHMERQRDKVLFRFLCVICELLFRILTKDGIL